MNFAYPNIQPHLSVLLFYIGRVLCDTNIIKIIIRKLVKPMFCEFIFHTQIEDPCVVIC